jgi:hypothetical protein
MPRAELLKLRSIGLKDYSVFDGRQRIGRIRFAKERSPGVWMWSIETSAPAPLRRRRCNLPIVLTSIVQTRASQKPAGALF